MVIRFDMRLLKKYKHKVQVQTTMVFCRSLWDCIVKQTFHAYLKALVIIGFPWLNPKQVRKMKQVAYSPVARLTGIPVGSFMFLKRLVEIYEY